MASQKDSELAEAKARLTKLETELKHANDELNRIQPELDAATNRLTTIHAATSAVLGQEDFLDDIVRLHQAAQMVIPSTQIRGGIIPSIQVAGTPSTVPTYRDAFELWMPAARGTLDIDRASIFLQQLDYHAGYQGAFLPWIHGALCKTLEPLTSRIEASPVWSMDLLVQLVTVMQLLVYVQHGSQTASQWVCGLLLLATHIWSILTSS